MTVGPADVARVLTGLGVREAQTLLVHSSLSSFGHVEGGAGALVAALEAAVGPRGHLMMPTFTYGAEPYDVASTPSRTGAVTEYFRTKPGTVRSAHPTHSIAASGAGAAQLVAGHDVEAPFGSGTPLDRLANTPNLVLLAGVTHIASSLIHVAQERAALAFLDRPKTVTVIEAGGPVERRVRRAGCSLGFDKLAPHLTGIVRAARAGNAPLLCMPADALVRIATGVLRENPSALFCDRVDCFACNEAASMLRSVSASTQP